VADVYKAHDSVHMRHARPHRLLFGREEGDRSIGFGCRCCMDLPVSSDRSFAAACRCSHTSKCASVSCKAQTADEAENVASRAHRPPPRGTGDRVAGLHADGRGHRTGRAQTKAKRRSSLSFSVRKRSATR
jgi:hypothetical protein